MSMTCLLCPAVAVADLLCVSCGAKLAVAKVHMESEEAASAEYVAVRDRKSIGSLERYDAWMAIRSDRQAQAFLAAYNAKAAELDRKDNS
jgi:hypothetical protein